MDELFKYYRESLVDGLCDEYKGYWQAASHDKDKLVRLAMSQQAIPHVATYMYEGRGLTKDFLLREFGQYLNGYVIRDADNVEGYTYAWYVDYDCVNDIDINTDVAHVSNTIGADIVIPKTKCPTIYVSNRSNIHVVCEGYNNIRLYLFDKSKVILEDIPQECEITIYKYSKECKCIISKYCFGKVNEHNKELRL